MKAIVIGRICAEGHPRIGHREEHCPLCVAIASHALVDSKLAVLADMYQTLEGENQTLRDQ